jgi:iron-sulfur cluster repair protein YtfE (RIC family)
MPNTSIIPIAATDTINEIVARYPSALAVLARFGLDVCCGGALPLATAALLFVWQMGRLLTV